MARIHARKRGRSSSTRPYRPGRPDWIEMDRDKVRSLILELHGKGLTSSQIGITLRDTHGIPDVKTALGASMYTILKDNGVKMTLPEDLRNLMRKAVRIGAHIKENSKDIHNKRQLQLTEAKIRRLVRYYKSRGVLPQEWTYSLDKAKLMAD